ncbi:Oidioi.mRNA.OKI2018_I69.chr2.g5856.t1.cds [Oikopleura dioica]|uniref:Oidioi.mRNA.OKI2018_I69.chr2.g5856.t1.cds n=1 Tax=Oikopleura dioica TaxID=34765 RepID=A0ABN7T140_OIKDI|nr:Oidioi.mRNA.OKI2018_I69.chr2.g5856.t1.cds [Oikopleura dioica]
MLTRGRNKTPENHKYQIGDLVWDAWGSAAAEILEIGEEKMLLQYSSSFKANIASRKLKYISPYDGPFN